jgi:hypothetical protein
VVLSVGRLSREKDLPTIIEAVRRLQTRLRPPPILVIAGDGPERLRLEELTSNEGFVFFVGHQEGTNLRQLFASAQVFAFASRLDTLGLVNFEALASGVPLVVPRDSNIASLLQHDRDAFCYPPGPSGLEEALAVLLEDRERSARLSAAGRRFVAEHGGVAVSRPPGRSFVAEGLDGIQHIPRAERTRDAQDDTDQSAYESENDRLTKELELDCRPGRTDREAQPDLPGSLHHRCEHHVHDADSSDQQRYQRHTQQESRQGIACFHLGFDDLVGAPDVEIVLVAGADVVPLPEQRDDLVDRPIHVRA